jgi:hypothetical protein
MLYRLGSPLVVLSLAAVCAYGQISFPGQYPNGQGSPGGLGIPFPGRGRRTRTTSEQTPTQSLDGRLRKISSTELVLESDDHLLTTVSLANSTRYYQRPSDANTGNGNPPGTAKRAEFQPGDQVTIEATQDDHSYYHATKVMLVKQGTATDRARASQPVDAASTEPGGGNTASDGDRPRLHRAGQPDTPDTPPSQPAPQPRTSAADNDSDLPTLRRGGSAEPAPAASAPAPRPTIHADEVGGVTRLPDAPVVESTNPARPDRDTDPVIESAREAAFSFVETLPNYVVKQFTTRYATQAARGGKTSWQALDTVTADVVSEGGTESYKNILVNGRPPKEAIEKTGAWSTGEYANLLQDILSSETGAHFRGQRPTTIANRAAFRYDFSVERANSHWHVFAVSESYTPEYTGAIWIDKQNSRVLRIEMAAQKLPRTFLLDTVESSLDYDYVQIGDGKFLLPVHSEALSCVRGTSDCTRNVIDFRNYRKFSADTNIIFEPSK